MSSSYTCVTEFIDDQDICKLGISLVLFDKAEFIGHDVPAGRIRALPSSLIDYEDELKTVLHDGMIDSSWCDAFGAHAVCADWAEMRHGSLL